MKHHDQGDINSIDSNSSSDDTCSFSSSYDSTEDDSYLNSLVADHPVIDYLVPSQEEIDLRFASSDFNTHFQNFSSPHSNDPNKVKRPIREVRYLSEGLSDNQWKPDTHWQAEKYWQQTEDNGAWSEETQVDIGSNKTGITGYWSDMTLDGTDILQNHRHHHYLHHLIPPITGQSKRVTGNGEIIKRDITFSSPILHSSALVRRCPSGLCSPFLPPIRGIPQCSYIQHPINIWSSPENLLRSPHYHPYGELHQDVNSRCGQFLNHHSPGFLTYNSTVPSISLQMSSDWSLVGDLTTEHSPNESSAETNEELTCSSSPQKHKETPFVVDSPKPTRRTRRNIAKCSSTENDQSNALLTQTPDPKRAIDLISSDLIRDAKDVKRSCPLPCHRYPTTPSTPTPPPRRRNAAYRYEADMSDTFGSGSSPKKR